MEAIWTAVIVGAFTLAAGLIPRLIEKRLDLALEKGRAEREAKKENREALRQRAEAMLDAFAQYERVESREFSHSEGWPHKYDVAINDIETAALHLYVVAPDALATLLDQHIWKKGWANPKVRTEVLAQIRGALRE